MGDETANRFAGAPDSGRPASGGDGLGSPLQTRAAFLKNWDWLAVVSINRGACERSRAQHGINSETGAACAADWEKLRVETLTLAETLDRLCAYHRRAPFFFSTETLLPPSDANSRLRCSATFIPAASARFLPSSAIISPACLTAKVWSALLKVCAQRQNSKPATA